MITDLNYYSVHFQTGAKIHIFNEILHYLHLYVIITFRNVTDFYMYQTVIRDATNSIFLR